MDILEFAINMELDGQKYYEEQAKFFHQEGLKAIFDMLADEEKAHAELMKNKRLGLPLHLAEPVRQGLQNVFSSISAFKSDIKEEPDPIDAYRMALEKERQSIDLYKKLLLEGGSVELFHFLIRQEEKHYEILEELVKLVDRPNSWVESAEFGIREEY
jgi:rubrerythrin